MSRMAPLAKAAPPVATAPVWKPTGVPLVDKLAGFSTIKDSGLYGLKLIAMATVGIYFASWMLTAIGNRSGPANDEGKAGFKPIYSLVAAASAPASALLPFYGIVYSTTVLGALLQVLSTKTQDSFNAFCLGYGDQVLAAVKVLTQMVQDLSEIVIIIGAAWTAIRLKDRVIAYIQNVFFGGVSQSGLARLARNFGSLIEYGIYLAAALAAISAFGFNITPLLASLGGASVVIGIAAQSLVKNVAGAITLVSILFLRIFRSFMPISLIKTILDMHAVF